MTKKEENDKDDSPSAFPPNPLVEIIRVSPSFVWALIVGLALLALHSPILRLIDQGRFQEFTVVGLFSVKLADVAGPGSSKPSEKELSILDSRSARIADLAKGKRILWVDDGHPRQNRQEREALQSFGIIVHIASNTEEAREYISLYEYSAILTDLERENGDPIGSCDILQRPDIENAGCELLRQLGELQGSKMPRSIIYSARSDIGFGMPPFARGMTNKVDELIHLVFDAIEREPVSDGNSSTR